MLHKLKYYIFLFLMSCAGGLPQPQNAIGVRAPTERAQHILNKSVSLKEERYGIWVSYCGGVWIDADHVLTAYHCLLNKGEEKVNTANVIHIGIYNEEGAYSAYVKQLDKSKDLALLRVDGKINHEIAELGDALPGIGENVYMVGPVGTFSWTYAAGEVSAYRNVEFFKKINSKYLKGKNAEWMQINLSIGHGDSGSGIFDSDGNLCSIADFIDEDVPGGGFAVDGKSIAEFLHGVGE